MSRGFCHRLKSGPLFLPEHAIACTSKTSPGHQQVFSGEWKTRNAGTPRMPGTSGNGHNDEV